ncbi:hypothetical protein Fleli_2473 [Bernardetia litoralis DSM 6794]|uniref:Lipoprotein n=1 Tax=Bernardetia litoralis (strain ATCC 23117 / DSM 6794 / NBRC 15988 / NCIMB 1366 / Fx l1 / Sio-4) TaxID=880071 RepID=I4ALK3_BERLS|nr:hypothetical protein [Bernardetia litoralis]AFM04838.1 hypothetical protein Fleli_2473 [Bernardetia litoralis DSM 6794]
MRKIILFLLTSIIFISSCNKIKSKAKETIKQGGKTVGETASDFFEGVSEGIEKNLKSEIVLSQSLDKKGLEIGSYSVENQGIGNNDNKLILYLIFNKNFDDTLLVKVFNKNNLEVGRTKLAIQNEANNAKHYNFVFDKRTHIDSKSKITLE